MAPPSLEVGPRIVFFVWLLSYSTTTPGRSAQFSWSRPVIRLPAVGWVSVAVRHWAGSMPYGMRAGVATPSSELRSASRGSGALADLFLFGGDASTPCVVPQVPSSLLTRGSVASVSCCRFGRWFFYCGFYLSWPRVLFQGAFASPSNCETSCQAGPKWAGP
jgi:hypothetical protein